MKWIAPLLLLTLVSGCSTLKGWFTPEGKLLADGRALEAAGHPLGAAASAVQALAVDPKYEDAQTLLARAYVPGQQEYQTSVPKWLASKEPARWDRLVELHRWQKILSVTGPSVGAPATDYDPTALREAELEAAGWHWASAQQLLARTPGPRQARKALAEGRVAEGYAADLPGLADWMRDTADAATQKVMIIPWFVENPGKLGALGGDLGAEVSRRLVTEPGLPPMTSVFSSDRLVTLPGAGLARLGFTTQPDALVLAREAGQNVVVLGQFTKAAWMEPRKTVRVENRLRQAVAVTPDHPEGVTVTWKAQVTYVTWTTSVQLVANVSVLEVDTGADLLTTVKEARVSDETTAATFTGDKDALTPDDLTALGNRPQLDDLDVLRDQAVSRLGGAVADAVRQALR